MTNNFNLALRILSRFTPAGNQERGVTPSREEICALPLVGLGLGLVPAFIALVVLLGTNRALAVATGLLALPLLSWWLAGFHSFHAYLELVEKLLPKMACPLKTEFGRLYWSFLLFSLAILVRGVLTAVVLWSGVRGAAWLVVPAVFSGTFLAERLLPPFAKTGFDEDRAWLFGVAAVPGLLFAALAGGLFAAAMAALLAVLAFPRLDAFLRQAGLAAKQRCYATAELIELLVLLAGAASLLER